MTKIGILKVMAILAFVSPLAGCSTLGYIGYLLAPEPGTVKVPAEFDALAGRSAVVVIYTDYDVQYDYPYARLGLSMAIASELKKHVENVKIISSRRVVAYQRQNLHWQSMDRPKLGELFGADYVLYVVLDEYTMREPGSINLFRGRIRAHASLYDTANQAGDARVWHGEDFSVVYPRHAPTGQPGQDDARIRYETEKRLAEMLAKKFYKHEVPKI